MTMIVESDLGIWTAADLVAHFGPIPLDRVRHDPLPGMATEADLLRINERHEALCELIDGVLVEKAVGNYESMLAVILGRFLSSFVAEHDLGVVLGADGMLRLRSGLVRLPDVSFVSWDRLPDRTALTRRSGRSLRTWPWKSSVVPTPRKRWNGNWPNTSRPGHGWFGICTRRRGRFGSTPRPIKQSR